MRRVFALSAAIFATQVLPAKADYTLNLNWGTQLGSAADEQYPDVATDSSGNIFVAGMTSGSFGGVYVGSFDAALIKLSSGGALLWARQDGTSGADRNYGAAVDSAGDVHVVGFTDGSLNGQTSNGGRDAFLTKYSSGGTRQFTNLYGTPLNDAASSAATGPGGNIHIAGWTGGDFARPSLGNYDAITFVRGSNGSYHWNAQAGSNAADYGTGVACDNLGNTYSVGRASGSVDGQPHYGLDDGFLVKYNSTGVHTWSVQFGTSNYEYAQDVAVDSANNIYVVGYTRGNYGGASAGDYDVFLAKFDSAGTALWVRQIGTSGSDTGTGIAIDSLDRVYITGTTPGNLLGMTNAGGLDAFVVAYDSGGTIVTKKLLGTNGHEQTPHLAIDTLGRIILVGSTPGNLYGSNAGVGTQDWFIASFIAPEPTSLHAVAVLGAFIGGRRRTRRPTLGQ